MAKTWTGSIPNKCQTCNEFIVDKFVDGRSRGVHSWAIMCSKCHSDKGCGFGVGCGQLYEFDGQIWHQTAGGSGAVNSEPLHPASVPEGNGFDDIDVSGAD